VGKAKLVNYTVQHGFTLQILRAKQNRKIKGHEYRYYTNLNWH